MARTLTASDRKSLIRLASTLPKGSPERKAILAGLSKSANPKVVANDVFKALQKSLRGRDYYLNFMVKGDIAKVSDMYGHGKPFHAEVFFQIQPDGSITVPVRLDSEGRDRKWSAGSFRGVEGKTVSFDGAVKILSSLFTRAAEGAMFAARREDEVQSGGLGFDDLNDSNWW